MSEPPSLLLQGGAGLDQSQSIPQPASWSLCNYGVAALTLDQAYGCSSNPAAGQLVWFGPVQSYEETQTGLIPMSSLWDRTRRSHLVLPHDTLMKPSPCEFPTRLSWHSRSGSHQLAPDTQDYTKAHSALALMELVPPVALLFLDCSYPLSSLIESVPSLLATKPGALVVSSLFSVRQHQHSDRSPSATVRAGPNFFHAPLISTLRHDRLGPLDPTSK